MTTQTKTREPRITKRVQRAQAKLYRFVGDFKHALGRELRSLDAHILFKAEPTSMSDAFERAG